MRVGGLDTYKTTQSKFFYLIPVGPKMIHGIDPYKRFLDVVAMQLTAADPGASVSIAQPQ